MLAAHDWECQVCGHIFEQIAEWDVEQVECQKCQRGAERIWLAPRSPHRQLQTPIVMWRYSNGKLGVAGGADSKTPKGAERVEIRSVGDYRKYTKELNSQLRSKEEQREERFRENQEAMEHKRRSRLSYLMGQETDPAARDIYRAALESNQGGHQKLPFSEFFSVAMEMDPSNYERD